MLLKCRSIFANSILIPVLMCLPIYLTGQSKEKITYEFGRTESGYWFQGNVEVNADPGCLLEISFEYDHVKALALDAKEVSLIEQGDNWNRISYTYQKFIYFKNTSVWNRTIDRNRNRVEFSLLSSENNHKVMPEMISSSGYYQINNQGEFCTMQYFQKCELTESSLTRYYLNKVKKNAIRFLEEFQTYSDHYCNSRTMNSEKQN